MKHSINDGFLYYIELVEKADFRTLFSSQATFDLLASLNEHKASYRYEPGKWSIKQIVGHMTDHERIMIYRTLRFSRKDTTLLPGYDQNLLVENSRFDALDYQQLLTDFRNVRAATNSFIAGLSDEQLILKGKAWKFELTVEEMLKATIGHEVHHMNVIRSRYLGITT